MQFWFQSVQWGLLPKQAKSYHFVTFLTVLSLPFFSATCPGRTDGPIFKLYNGLNDAFPRKVVPFGG